jgi:hypothetical protein
LSLVLLHANKNHLRLNCTRLPRDTFTPLKLLISNLLSIYVQAWDLACSFGYMKGYCPKTGTFMDATTIKEPASHLLAGRLKG